MPTITRSALVEHAASDMYQLVTDVDRYPEFLPWCKAARVLEQTEDSQTATVTIDERMKSASFTTRNQLVPAEAIHMTLVDGPFRQLSGTWRFKSLAENACRVELEIDFEFKTKVFAIMMSPAFSKICDTMVDAFVRRANQLGAAG